MTTSDAPRFRRYAPEERAAMLVQAGLACLAEGGITAFTVDNICRRAEASRGLIAHHFGSKEGLLAAVYEAAYQPMLEMISGDPPLPLGTLLDRMFDGESHDTATLRIWLALWGEVTVNPALRAAHRRNYGRYRATVEAAIEDHCFARGLKLDAGALATTAIALIDGLWLEQCIDPEGFDADRARASAHALLEPVLGPLDQGKAP
ncbi:MAG: TetR family transcriptional regulator C-terminal domain-containing protein [Paracoccaceae bacterium]